MPSDELRAVATELLRDLDVIEEFFASRCAGYSDCTLPHKALDRIRRALLARPVDEAMEFGTGETVDTAAPLTGEEIEHLLTLTVCGCDDTQPEACIYNHERLRCPRPVVDNIGAAWLVENYFRIAATVGPIVPSASLPATVEVAPAAKTFRDPSAEYLASSYEPGDAHRSAEPPTNERVERLELLLGQALIYLRDERSAWAKTLTAVIIEELGR